MLIRQVFQVSLFALAGFAWFSPNPLFAQVRPVINGVSEVREVFPSPPGLQDAVEFWQRVFGVWPRNQVVLHDDEYLGAIYEVIHLPPPWEEGLTREQSALIQQRRAALENRLAGMESRLRLGLPLSKDQQGLHDILVKAGGRSAVFGSSERVRHQRGMQERFLQGLQISGRYVPHIREIFRSKGLPEDLALLPHIESSFVNHSRSKVGAAGIWQFMRSTGVNYLTINEAVDERFDPIFAARGAARYLDSAYRRLGDWGLAITSYNHGINGMASARAQFGPDIGKIVRHYKGRLFGFASRNFYAEFLAVRSIIHNLDRYFPRGVRFDRPIDHARVRLFVPASVSQLADHYRVGVGILEYLNPAFTERALRGRIALPSGTELWLPKHSVANPQSITIYSQRSSLLPAKNPRPAIKPQIAARKPVATPLRNAAAPSQPSPRVSRVHVVRKGESAFRIATRYGVKLNAMMAVNDLRPDAVIRPGQRLKIPAR